MLKPCRLPRLAAPQPWYFSGFAHPAHAGERKRNTTANCPVEGARQPWASQRANLFLKMSWKAEPEPAPAEAEPSARPAVTLTYAQSLDGRFEFAQAYHSHTCPARLIFLRSPMLQLTANAISGALSKLTEASVPRSIATHDRSPIRLSGDESMLMTHR